jgi:hypothetical protein
MDKKPTLEELKKIQEAKRVQLAEARRVSQQLELERDRLRAAVEYCQAREAAQGDQNQQRQDPKSQ